MKALLIVTAVIEAGTGLVLLIAPALLAALLFGTELESPTAVAVARVAGAALLALGLACWLARDDSRSRLAAAMMLYNTAATAILAQAGFASGLAGVLLWPVVILHVVMAIWCIACLRTNYHHVRVGSKNRT